MSVADRYMVYRYQRLLKWRSYVDSVVRAARDILGNGIRIYIVGGAAEDRLTALSDIDIAIVSDSIPENPRDRVELAIEIRDRAVTVYGLPIDYPIDLHLYTSREFEEEKKKFYRKVVEIS